MTKVEILESVRELVKEGKGIVSIKFFLKKSGVKEDILTELLNEAEKLIEDRGKTTSRKLPISIVKLGAGLFLLSLGVYYIYLGGLSGRIAIWSLGLCLVGGILFVIEFVKALINLFRK